MFRFASFALIFAACGSPMAAPDASTDAEPASADAGSPDAGPADAGPADAGRDTSTDLCVADSQVGLPADDSVHSGEPVEWWYWTGHLEDGTGRRFGYQVTFFVFDFGAMLMNAALTDVDGSVFHPGAQFVFARPEIVPNGFHFMFDQVSGEGGDGTDHLAGTFDGVSLDLMLHATDAPVLNHGDGREDYPFGGYTYYYSRPRMDTSGTLTVGGETLDVTGTSWFDHQWGDLTDISMLGWDWFGIELDDGRNIMLFLVHGSDGYVSGTISDATCGGARELTADQVTVTSRGTWTSPDTSCTYPLGWDVQVDGISLGITQVMDAQEHANTMRVSESYWEGDATVDGDVTGRAYVELTGYCSP